MKTDEDKLADFIARLVSSSGGTLRGSSLGISVQSEFPNLDLKGNYGGLKNFISRFCRDSVDFVEKRGGDDVFAPAGSKPQPSEHSVNFWKIFSNPESWNNLYYDCENGTLEASSGQMPTTDGLFPVEKISHDEQKTWMQEFAVECVDARSREIFSSATQSSNYWRVWSGLLTAIENRRYYSDWLEFRRLKIVETFQTRLKKFGLEDDQIKKAEYQLSNSPEDPHSKEANSGKLQALIDVLKKLSNDELDRVLIPASGILSFVESRD